MDPATLVATVAAALVTAITTDAWQEAQTAIMKVWRRVHPNRAETIGEELAETRHEVLVARQQDDAEAEQVLEGDWRRRLERLVAADPTITDELQEILDNVLTPLLKSANEKKVSNVSMHAHATDNARIYQAGQDMHITGQ